MAKFAQAKFDPESDTLDARRMMDVIASMKAEQTKVAELQGAIDVLATVFLLASPRGFAFHCSECGTNSYSIDFVKLADGNCPNCEERGGITVLKLTAAKSVVDTTHLPTQIRAVRDYVNGQRPAPQETVELCRQMFDTLTGLGLT